MEEPHCYVSQGKNHAGLRLPAAHLCSSGSPAFIFKTRGNRFKPVREKSELKQTALTAGPLLNKLGILRNLWLPRTMGTARSLAPRGHPIWPVHGAPPGKIPAVVSSPFVGMGTVTAGGPGRSPANGRGRSPLAKAACPLPGGSSWWEIISSR